MRRKNRSLLLSKIRRFPGLSAADAARWTGLAPQTVSVLLRGLEAENLVRRGDARKGRRGQPALPLFLNAEGGYAVGVEIGWQHVNLVLSDLTGAVLERRHWLVDYQDPDVLLPQLERAIAALVETLDAPARERFVGVGVAMPYFMEKNMHLVTDDPEVGRRIGETDFATHLQTALGLPVFVQNDGTAAYRAECAYGRGTEFGDAMHIFIGTFIGSGLFIDGKLIEGGRGEAATIGSSMVPDSGGKIRSLHQIASIKALEGRIAAAGKPVMRTAPEEWDWPLIMPEVHEWTRAAADGLALAIANGCTVFDFAAAIIDGALPECLLDALTNLIRQRLARLPISIFEPPIVARGRMGALGPARGAANLPIYLDIFSPNAPRRS